MVSVNMLVQIYSFMKVFLYFFIVAGGVCIFVFLAFFKYVVEIHRKTGSGFSSFRYYAYRRKRPDGNFELVTVRRKSFLFPKDYSSLYRQRFRQVVRFYEKGPDDYHPLELKHNTTISVEKDVEGNDVVKETSIAWMEPVPQNVKFLFKQQQVSIAQKYAKKEEFLSKYGGLIGVGFAAVAFIMAAFFISENLSEVTNLAASYSAQALKAGGQVISAAP